MAKIMVRIIATVQTRGDSEITGVKTVWLSHWAWLVLGWKTDLQKRLLRDKQFKGKREMALKFKWSHSYSTSQNNQGRED
jgi:hypothetical protein